MKARVSGHMQELTVTDDRRALEVNPRDAYTLGNYAFFLASEEGGAGVEEAEKHYRLAMEMDPSNAR